jgi:hypothetical protein
VLVGDLAERVHVLAGQVLDAEPAQQHRRGFRVRHDVRPEGLADDPGCGPGDSAEGGHDVSRFSYR